MLRDREQLRRDTAATKVKECEHSQQVQSQFWQGNRPMDFVRNWVRQQQGASVSSRFSPRNLDHDGQEAPSANATAPDRLTVWRCLEISQQHLFQ